MSTVNFALIFLLLIFVYIAVAAIILPLMSRKFSSPAEKKRRKTKRYQCCVELAKNERVHTRANARYYSADRNNSVSIVLSLFIFVRSE